MKTRKRNLMMMRMMRKNMRKKGHLLGFFSA